MNVQEKQNQTIKKSNKKTDKIIKPNFKSALKDFKDEGILTH